MTCEVDHYKRCTLESMVIYAAFRDKTKEVHVCEKHWEKHCDPEDKFDLREHFTK